MLASIDLGTLRAVFREGIVSFYDSGIIPGFLSGPAKTAFDIIENHWKAYGALPDVKTMYLSTGITFQGIPDEPMAYWAHLLRKRHRDSLIRAGLSEVVTAWEANDSDLAYEKLKSLVLRMDSEVPLSQRPSCIYNTDLLKPHYEKLRSKVINIPTPWPTLSKRILGFQPEDLTTLVAKSGVGKTFLLLLMLQEVFNVGKKVLLVSTEMRQTTMMARASCFLCKVPYSRFRQGELLEVEYNEMMSILEAVKNNPNYLIFGEGFNVTVEHVEAIISEEKPDIVGIDGAYLLKGQKIRSGDRDSIAQIWTALKGIAKRTKVPIIAISQMNRNPFPGKERKLDTDRVAFSEDIVRLSDNVIFATRDADLPGTLTLTMGKLRESDSFEDIVLHWDFDNCNFSEMQFGGYAPSII